MSPDPAGQRTTPGMAEPYWYPLYEKCQELSIPLIVHGTNCLDPRISMIRSNYQIGFLVEQYIATQILTHSDVFDKFPELKVVVCHGGGALDRFVVEAGWRNGRGVDRSNNLFFDSSGAPLSAAPGYRDRSSKLVPYRPVDGMRDVDAPPLWPPRLKALPARETPEWVLENAGARPWDRDATDRRLIREVRTGAGRISRSE